MIRFFFVLVSCIVLFTIESAFSQLLGASFKPNLLLVAVVFFNLFRNLKTSLIAAFVGGLLADSVSGYPGCMNIFTFTVTAFFTAWIKMYIYQPGSPESRLLIVFCSLLVANVVQFIIISSVGHIFIFEALVRVIIPQMVLTLFLTTYCMEYLKLCALKFFA